VFDKQAVYKFVSLSVKEILDYSQADLVGTSAFSYIHEDDQEKTRELYYNILQGPGMQEKTLIRFLHKNGEYRMLEFIAHNALHDDAIKGIVVNARDITEEQAIIEKHKQSEQDYRGLFENAHDPILIFDPENETILNANSPTVETYGISRDKLIGQNLKHFSKNTGRGDQLIQKTRAGQQPRKFETIQYDKSGNEIVMEVNATRIQYQGQEAILSINRDITERKKLERDLRARNIELSEFLYSTSHDLRSPLTTIEGLVDIGKSETEDTPQYFEYIEKPLTQLRKTLNGLTNIANIAKRSTNIQRIKLDWLLDKTLQQLVETCPGINDITRFRGEITDLNGDNYLLGLMLYELLENAYLFQQKSAVPDPFIEVSLEKNNGRAFINIRDEGPGINPELPLCDMFYRGSEKSEGSGLGLYLVKNAAEKLGGSVYYKNEESGGSLFQIYLSP